LADGLFQVTTRGVGETEVFRDDLDRRLFLRLFATIAKRHRWRVEAFCLMTTHYHLVVVAIVADLSRGMQRLNGDYARGFNRRHGRRGHLWSERFASWVIDDDLHLENTIRYVLLNPVRAGLCKGPEEWPWSGSAYGKTG
jgi:REP element-mobilizing transposase RayT